MQSNFRLTGSLFSVLIVLLCMPLATSAQKSIAVSEVQETMSMGTRNGFQAILSDQSKKDVEAVLEDLLKEYDKKAKMEKSGKNEAKVDDVIIPSISDQPVDLYFLFSEDKSSCTVTGFFDMGTSFLSSQVYPDRFRSGEVFMQKLGLRAEKTRLAGLVKAATDDMQSLERDKDGLEKDKEKLEKSIADCEATIAKAKSDLDTNASDTKKKSEEIGQQKEKLGSLQKELDQYRDH